MTYAVNTSVPVERTKAELGRLLTKHGATAHAVGEDHEALLAYVLFGMGGRRVKLSVPLPRLADFQKAPKPYAMRPSNAQAQKRHEQACRARWRAVLLLTKAKLEAIELGLSTVEREFLADVLLPSGRTIYEQIQSDVEKAYDTGTMPPLLGPSTAA
jgi:hypothetical protein